MECLNTVLKGKSIYMSVANSIVICRQLRYKCHLIYIVVQRNRTPVIFSNNFNKHWSIPIIFGIKICKESSVFRFDEINLSWFCFIKTRMLHRPTWTLETLCRLCSPKLLIMINICWSFLNIWQGPVFLGHGVVQLTKYIYKFISHTNADKIL